ncbi:MAG: alanyl-tRNA editing protein [Gammaproteobacteria bacterium]|nr:alanyl-tRNA editing protein [Gammaproteobacteria bacterium]
MHPTKALYRQDAYCKLAPAKVLALTEEGHVVLDQTLFYPTGGGQPGDIGVLTSVGKADTQVINTRNNREVPGQIMHMVEQPCELVVGDEVIMHLNWEVRYRRMRVHTALHLLSVVLPYPVTGGAIGECLTEAKIDGRLDFDIANPDFDKAQLSQQLQAMVNQHANVSNEWISEAELDAQPDLVKTMSVQPPRGAGQVRLVNIDGLDLQPCGGTHLANIGEIGSVRIRKIENKGKINRRVRLVLDA